MSSQDIDYPEARTSANWTVGQAAAYLGLSVHFLNRSRIIGNGPVYFKLGGRVAYSQDDLDAWVNSRRRTSTSQVVEAA